MLNNFVDISCYWAKIFFLLYIVLKKKLRGSFLYYPECQLFPADHFAPLSPHMTTFSTYSMHFIINNKTWRFSSHYYRELALEWPGNFLLINPRLKEATKNQIHHNTCLIMRIVVSVPGVHCKDLVVISFIRLNWHDVFATLIIKWNIIRTTLTEEDTLNIYPKIYVDWHTYTLQYT